MSSLPGAIIFVNNDLNDVLKNKISSQLFVNEIVLGQLFDARVTADGYYADNVRNIGLRLLVIRDLSDTTNRILADVVIFVKSGLASVLKNNFGEPGQTYTVDGLYIHELLRANNKIL